MHSPRRSRNHLDPGSRSTIASALLVLLAIGLLYLYNIDGWLINEDEGTDLYEAWRIAEGDDPGVDLITEQPPAFLLAGVGLGLLSGFNVAVLRGVTALLVLASGWPVFLIGRELWGPRAGLIGMTLYLLTGDVHGMARQYRPDPWMLAFCVAGLCLFTLSQTRNKRWFVPLAGTMCGLGTLCKLFGVLPLGGCILFLACQALCGRTTVRRAVEDAALLVVPFALVTIGGILAFYPPGSSYYSSVLGQHWQIGREAGLTAIMAKGLVALAKFLRGNLVFLVALPLFPRLATSHRAGESVLAWQLPTGLAFLFLSRPIWSRYWLYLVPSFSLILGSLVDRILERVESRLGPRRQLLTALVSLLPLGAAVMQSAPAIVRNLRWTEDYTQALAAMIAEHTAPDDIVLADYAGLNFHARRRSIPQASIIATGRIMAGFVTGSELIAEIEARDVRMVVHHVSGGTAPPTHLIYLHDYQAFYSYLVRHFCLLDRFDRAGQLFELYLQCPQQQATGLPVGDQWLERQAHTRLRPRSPTTSPTAAAIRDRTAAAPRCWRAEYHGSTVWGDRTGAGHGEPPSRSRWRGAWRGTLRQSAGVACSLRCTCGV